LQPKYSKEEPIRTHLFNKYDPKQESLSQTKVSGITIFSKIADNTIDSNKDISSTNYDSKILNNNDSIITTNINLNSNSYLNNQDSFVNLKKNRDSKISLNLNKEDSNSIIIEDIDKEMQQTFYNNNNELRAYHNDI